MTEKPTGEVVRPKEQITPDSVKSRVMEFFEGIDLDTDGESYKGLIKIKTRSYPHIQETTHKAVLNGFEVAEYTHITSGSNLDPLPEGKDRTKSRYVLRGYVPVRGELAIRYTEYERQGPEMKISVPPTALAPGKTGTPENFDKEDLEFVTEWLGLKS